MTRCYILDLLKLRVSFSRVIYENIVMVNHTLLRSVQTLQASSLGTLMVHR